MTKRQLIDEIVSINPTAEPGFLARFEDGQLDEYLGHLRVLRTPRLRGDPHRYDKYFSASEPHTEAEGPPEQDDEPVAEETDAAERAALLDDEIPEEPEYRLLDEIDGADVDAEPITEPDQLQDEPDELQPPQADAAEQASRQRVRPWRRTHAEDAADQTPDGAADEAEQIDDDRGEGALEGDAPAAAAAVGAEDDNEDPAPTWLF